MNWINLGFWLCYVLLDTDLMIMNSDVDFYELSNDVRIVFNWYVGYLILMNIYWIDLFSLIIIVSILNYCSWLLVRALWYWIGLFSIELRCWGCCGGKMPFFLLFWCFLYLNSILIGMVHLWWRWYVFLLKINVALSVLLYAIWWS